MSLSKRLFELNQQGRFQQQGIAFNMITGKLEKVSPKDVRDSELGEYYSDFSDYEGE